jgi:hypothetical protein
MLPSDGTLADLTEDPTNATVSFLYLADEPGPQRFSIEGAGSLKTPRCPTLFGPCILFTLSAGN